MPRSAGKVRRRPRLRHVAALAVIALTAGCSLDYEGITAEETASAGIPDTVAVNVVHRVHKGGRLSLQLEAARAETWSSKNQTILSDARFVEFDESGGTATEGRARRIVYHTDTEDAEVEGGVHVHSASEKGDVSAENLAWENKPKRLTAPVNEEVVIHKDDGTLISGRGFQGDFRRRQLVFTGPVQGVYVSKEEK
jgi:LPS export ABC transporter protein LptC